MSLPPFHDPFLSRPLHLRSRECQVVEMWIRAALSLPRRERIQAMLDIAEMVGVTYAMIQGQAAAIKAREHGNLVKIGLPASRRAKRIAVIPVRRAA